jgi:DinB superfamily
MRIPRAFAVIIADATTRTADDHGMICTTQPTAQEDAMGARGDALARQFETKAAEATEAIERLSDADWRKVTTAEHWPVGVVAHHIAVSHQGLGSIIKLLADGKPGPGLQLDTLHAMNARHAQEFANCTKAETVALLKTNAAGVATTLRSIADADFDHSGTVLAGMPPMSAGQLAGGLLCSHVDEHLGSIRATVGR